MPKLTPISWARFVKRMISFGFAGPYQEGKHPYMIKGDLSITIPNRHGEDFSSDLLSRILRQAGISRTYWLKER